MFRQVARSFSTTSRRANLIADLYVKELKAFKPTPLSAADAQSATKPWKLPQPAKVPAVEAEGADALAAYDAQTVEVAASGSDAQVQDYKPDEWFVFPADEEPGHHH
ncbi:hypothetical protein CANINC_003768 [Pichia inconspicua]|uniref:ATP synthase subunit H, mitochondrial n=1 Tax=Pichia inconspicua TaxID=52247 RepID=A0A4T0WY45_9ASCO|nr:hypothetical protein CANINC_003768 [[Candida] inconspicua]